MMKEQTVSDEADRYSARPVVGLCWTQVCSCLRVAIVEGTGTLFALLVIGIADFSQPATARSLLSMLYFCPLFDAGLDLGFYLFHRACHRSKLLYKLVHLDHHADTAREHGRLVAYETYTITWVETASITSSYLLGFGLVALAKGGAALSLFEIATLITWGHTVELMGHTAVSSTPKHHPMRAVVELLGLDLLVIDHTMHHKAAC